MHNEVDYSAYRHANDLVNTFCPETAKTLHMYIWSDNKLTGSEYEAFKDQCDDDRRDTRKKQALKDLERRLNNAS